jgi:TonB family protein
VFDTSRPVTLTGTISQMISRPTSNLSYLFFRISMNGTNWTIQIRDQQLRILAVPALSLVGDYTPEMSRLKVGTTVIVKGYETKQRDRRLLLVPEIGPNAISGIRVSDAPSEDAVFPVGGPNGASTPICKVRPEPNYSDDARKAHINGTVVVDVIIQKDGRIDVVRIAKSVGFGLDEEAKEVLKSWKCDPGQVNGQPVATRLPIAFEFRLKR